VSGLALSRAKATWVELLVSGAVRSGDWLGNRNSKRAIGPFLRLCHFHWVQPVAEHAFQLDASAEAGHRDHPFSALQTSCHPVHGRPPLLMVPPFGTEHSFQS
jgi:hypothetical protein